MEKLLILGGTNFIGRNLVEQLIQLDKFEITLFNRQESNIDLFPTLQKIKGDRTTKDINKIGLVEWDYVIDLSCYHPEDLENTLQNLSNSLKRYVFISTCSVYDGEAAKSILKTEKSAILTCTKEQREDRKRLRYYGNKKAACERILIQNTIPSVILRPALVFGQYDYTDRFYYWLYQVKTKPTLLLPNNGKSLFSITYVDDLVNIIIQSLTIKTTETTFNVISEPQISIEKIVQTAELLLEKKPKKISTSADFLIKNDVKEWFGIPLWINHNYFTFSNEKLIQTFNFQPIQFETAVRKTIDYHKKIGWIVPTYGMEEEKRLSILTELEK